jgi:hypothetical protein
MKPLDFVKTPKGNIALVTETNNGGKMASIAFIGGGNPSGEHNAWWRECDGLIVIDSLPRILALNTAHPFGTGRDDVKLFFNT